MPEPSLLIEKANQMCQHSQAATTHQWRHTNNTPMEKAEDATFKWHFIQHLEPTHVLMCNVDFYT